MASMIWLDVTMAAAGGVAAGWIAHTVFGRRRRSFFDLEGVGVPEPRAEQPEPPQPPLSDHIGPDRIAPGPPAVRVSDGANSAGRIILHLASLGRLGNDDVARVGFTQGGIAESLGLRQGTLAKTLARLEAADVVEVGRRHVSGKPRRLKVYRLTALGESVSRDLRRQRAAGGTFPAIPPNRPG